MSKVEQANRQRLAEWYDETSDAVVLTCGRKVSAGEPVRVKGESGDFKFKYVRKGAVTCWGGPAGHQQFRSFTLDRIMPPKRKVNRRELTEEERAEVADRLRRGREAKKGN